jgi:hypothetical protein
MDMFRCQSRHLTAGKELAVAVIRITMRVTLMRLPA